MAAMHEKLVLVKLRAIVFVDKKHSLQPATGSEGFMDRKRYLILDRTTLRSALDALCSDYGDEL